MHCLAAAHDLALRVLHGNRVAQAQLLAAPALHELLREEALDVVVDLQHAVEAVAVLPRRHHMPHSPSLVLELHGLAYERVLLRYLLNVSLPEQHAGVAVALAVGIDGAPQQHSPATARKLL